MKQGSRAKRIVSSLFCLCVAVCALPAGAAEPDLCRDDSLLITDGKVDDVPVFWLTTLRTIEATVAMRIDHLSNLAPSHPLPLNFAVDRPYNKYEILRLNQKNTEQPYAWKGYFYHYVIGAPSPRPTVEYVYSQLWPHNQQISISQSYFGTHSHQKGSPDEYAVDILVPVGTPVLAARGGVVVAYRNDSNQGGPEQKYQNCANYVYIKHNDGTYAAYLHLKYNGVTVRLGQSVNAGTVIGYSGETGWATEPHVHFKVYRVKAPATIYSIPFKMNTSRGIVSQLEEGECY